MQVLEIDSQVKAFIRPEDGANVGLIQAEDCMLLIDTASSPAEIRGLLSAVDTQPEQVSQVVNTHFHTDHTWGNQLFDCPILAHRLCLERMRLNLQDEWSEAELQAYRLELEQTNPQKAEEVRLLLQELHIKLPNQVFERQVENEIGNLKYVVIHMGGHTPDSAIVWLPERGILFASDLIFQGRYPYLFDANIPDWIVTLQRLTEYHAQVIIPGHGVRCSAADIAHLKNYLQETWDRVGEHIRQGHTAEETVIDAAFPFFAPGKYEKLHQVNIRLIYEQITSPPDRD
jgi:glyoxylase-like metal-dependent hydrolase (beta-lactamase superfamily II)